MFCSIVNNMTHKLYFDRVPSFYTRKGIRIDGEIISPAKDIHGYQIMLHELNRKNMKVGFQVFSKTNAMFGKHVETEK